MPKKIFLLCLILFTLVETSFAAKTIKLPPPKYKGTYTLEESIVWRRSEHAYQKYEITLEQLSQILWAAQGITDNEFGFRAAPSAGALYPLTIYVVKSDGVYRYIPDGHKLVQTDKTDQRQALVRASLGQAYISEAPVNIIIAANFRITEAKYGVRAYRYVLMEIGHVAENIQLQAVALGLSSIPVGAFWDNVVKKIVNLPDTQDPLYIIPIGYRRDDQKTS